MALNTSYFIGGLRQLKDKCDFHTLKCQQIKL